MNIHDALKAFEIYDGKYKREEMEFAVANREEITPYLLSILENISEDPEKYMYDDYYAHIYAFILLGYFREPRTNDIVIKIFSFTEEVIEPLFGDLITSDLKSVLFLTCNGSVEKIKSLITNRNAYGYCRTYAVESLVYAVGDGVVSRKEVLRLLSSLFTEDEFDLFPDFLGLVAADICDLSPDQETMKIIAESYNNGLVPSGIIGFGKFEKAISKGEARSLEIIREKIKENMPDDIHGYMSCWACFDKKDNLLYSQSGSFSKSALRNKKKRTRKSKNAKKKKKRKKR